MNLLTRLWLVLFAPEVLIASALQSELDERIADGQLVAGRVEILDPTHLHVTLSPVAEVKEIVIQFGLWDSEGNEEGYETVSKQRERK
jgi:hypothetical protein